jgi:hypothetical protein
MLCTLCLVLESAPRAFAHDLTLSGIRIVYRGRDVLVTVTTPISRLLRAEGTGRTTLTPVELDLAVRRRLHLRFGGTEPIMARAEVVGDNENDMLSWQTVLPVANAECDVPARLYPEDPNARTLATVIRHGHVYQEAMLTASHPALRHGAPAQPSRSKALAAITAVVGRLVEPLIVLALIALSAQGLRRFQNGDALGSARPTALHKLIPTAYLLLGIGAAIWFFHRLTAF